MIIRKMYLCQTTKHIIKYNAALLSPFFSDDDSSLIFISVDCFSYFKPDFQTPNFCFEEVKKCLSDKFFKKVKNILLPIADFEKLI